MEFSWELRKEFSSFFMVYLIHFLSFSQIQSLLIGFCFWWVSTSGCCFSKDKQHRTRISVSEWGLRKRNFSILDLPLYFRASFFSLNGALSDLQQEKRGSLGEKLGFLFFQENWLEFSWVPFYCRSTFFIIIKKGFLSFGIISRGKLALFCSFLKLEWSRGRNSYQVSLWKVDFRVGPCA